MEDWQQWQQRADQVAESLAAEVEDLDRQFLAETTDPTFRAFWPRFRDLKERVRTAPAIKLDAKLDLERKLRGIGSRAYKAQEGAYAESSARKDELLAGIATLRAQAEAQGDPRDLRATRRELDGVRNAFDSGTSLVPADRQAVWESWREANNLAWQRLNAVWEENETFLRGILTEARSSLDASDAAGVRTAVSRFFEALRSREARQAAMNAMKQEADGLRRESEHRQERRASEKIASQQASMVSPVPGWRAELTKNRDGVIRLRQEVENLEHQYEASGSILEQAMLRGNLVEKRRKLDELERSSRSLEQKIEQSEETPLISTG